MSKGSDPRSAFCDHLRNIHVRSYMGRRRKVRHRRNEVDEWFIDVVGGPIGHILIRDEYNMSYSTASDWWNREIHYLVPDVNIHEKYRHGLGIGPGIRRNIGLDCWEIFGDRWTDHETIGMGDPSLAKAVMKRAPSRAQWEEYEEQARRLVVSAIPKLEEEDPDWLEQLEQEKVEIRVWAQRCVEFLRDQLGFEAQASDPETPSEQWFEIWIDVAQGPIRRVKLSSDIDERHGRLYVPDRRLRPNSPDVSAYLVTAKSFFGIGRVSGVKWSRGEGNLAKGLNRDPAVKQALSTAGLTWVGIRSEPEEGGWLLEIEGTNEWKKPLWDCYEAIARHLLSFRFSTS